MGFKGIIMAEENPFLMLAELTGQAAGLAHAQAAIIHQILIRRGLTSVEEIADIAEGMVEDQPSEFVRDQLQVMINNYRSGRGPIFTVIDGGKSN